MNWVDPFGLERNLVLFNPKDLDAHYNANAERAHAPLVYRRLPMPDALLLSARDLERSLDLPAVLSALTEAFEAEYQGAWNTPRRIAAHTRSGALLAMPCGGGSPELLGAKLVSLFPDNARSGLPSISGLYALFDASTGSLRAVMDGGYLTRIRTAAVSALATRHLAAPRASTLGILGAGAQAAFHVRLLAQVRPVERVVIWARRLEQAEALVAELRSRDDLAQVTSWRVASKPDEATANEVVVTATSSSTPVLRGAVLAQGAHVNAIGAHTRNTREIDSEAVARAGVLVVESGDTLLEAGDFQVAQEERGGVTERVMTLGALLHSSQSATSAPRDPRAISIFKSCGVAFEDLAVASLAVTRARELDLGQPFRFDL